MRRVPHPAAVAIPDLPSGLLSADWVAGTPLDGATRSAASAAVTAQGVGEFTVQTLNVVRQEN